jgi:hypothetical protein
MLRFTRAKHVDLTELFKCDLTAEPKRGSAADSITKINILDVRVGMIVVVLNSDHQNDWVNVKITAWLQKTCDAPFVIELIEKASTDDDRDLTKGYINTDEIKSVWVLNQSVISEIISQPETDPTQMLLKCEPIAPSASIQMISSSMSRASSSSDHPSGYSGSSNSAMVNHNSNDRKLFACLRVSNNNEELVQSFRGNHDDIQKDSTTLVLLAERVPVELRHLPIASSAAIHVIRDFKSFNENSSYNSAKKEFSGVGLNMCLPWADLAQTQLTEITDHTQLAEALQVLQQVLEGVWLKQSNSIFGPWFSDLREEFVSTTIRGFRNLPIKLQIMTANKWVANMFTSFTRASLVHLSMEGFNQEVRKSLKINVMEIQSDLQTAINIVQSQRPISSAGLSAATVGYALAKGITVDQKPSGGGGPSSTTNSSTPLGPAKRKIQKTAPGKQPVIDSPEVKKLKSQLAHLEHQVKQASGPKGKLPYSHSVQSAPPGNTPPTVKSGVCISRIAFLLGINPSDCTLGYPKCGRPHIDLEPITPIFKATLRGYVSGFKSGPFKSDLEAKIAALV